MLNRLLPVLFAALLPVAAAGAQTATEPQAGREYVLIDPAQTIAPANGKIEVAEVFSYTCIHCARFEPVLKAWKARQPADVNVVAVPTAFGGAAEVFARAYYAAESTGVLDKTHQAMFDAIHVQSRPFRGADDVAAFYAEHGVDKDSFASTMSSFAVNAKIARAKQVVPRWGIEGTPSLIVAGKYRVLGGARPGFDGMLDTAEYLIARERASAGR